MRATALASALLLAPLAIGASASSAQAESFDERAKAARYVADANGMTSLFWSQGADCTKAKSDLLRRQCEGVRAARKASVAKETYLVEDGSEAVALTADAEKNSVQVDFRSCLWCGQDGAVVVGSGEHSVTGAAVSAPSLGVATKAFKKAKVATHWQAHIATRLRGQLLVKVPSALETFKVGARDGYKVEVVGYRLYDPCKGEVVVTSEKKPGPAPLLESACKDEPALDTEPKVAKKPEVVLPERLTPAQIKKSLKALKAESKVCYGYYGIEGRATFKMTIAGNGTLAKAEQLGDFKGTPTGLCLDEAMKAVTFPKSKKAETPISYPIVLR